MKYLIVVAGPTASGKTGLGIKLAQEFETSIFTGKYITPLGENYLEDLEVSRQDEVKAQREKAKAQLGFTIFTAGIFAEFALST